MNEMLCLFKPRTYLYQAYVTSISVRLDICGGSFSIDRQTISINERERREEKEREGILRVSEKD